jgi:hypothetical protein
MRDSLPARCPRFLIVFSLLLSCTAAIGQEADSPSIGAFAGAGFQHDGSNTSAIQIGGSIDLSAPNRWIGWSFEGGYAGSFANLHGGSALFSVNYLPSWHVQVVPKLYPFATVGYTQLFGTGSAINFGAGVDFRLNQKFGIRLEGRDYFSFSPQQHNFAIRIGFRRRLEME